MPATSSPSLRRASRWHLKEAPETTWRALATELSLQPLTARVLVARGLTDAASARRFLAPSLADLHDPLLMAGMASAVARIGKAIAQNEKMLLYGDYDVDGTSSVVLLLKTFELLGAKATYHVPHRLRDGYGMRSEVIEQAAADGIQLIISVDTGIRAGEVVRQANELSIDVIVTDHHLPETELPPAIAVLNPNRPDCAYPEKNLCGAGVAFKLAQALMADASLHSQAWPETRRTAVAESLLKLVAIATVADVVPLTGENRIIVHHGLRVGIPFSGVDADELDGIAHVHRGGRSQCIRGQLIVDIRDGITLDCEERNEAEVVAPRAAFPTTAMNQHDDGRRTRELGPRGIDIQSLGGVGAISDVCGPGGWSATAGRGSERQHGGKCKAGTAT